MIKKLGDENNFSFGHQYSFEQNESNMCDCCKSIAAEPMDVVISPVANISYKSCKECLEHFANPFIVIDMIDDIENLSDIVLNSTVYYKGKYIKIKNIKL